MSSLASGLSLRPLQETELNLLWSIDRSERIDGLYELRDGVLHKQAADIDLRGWPEGDPEKYHPEHEDAFHRGSWFMGVFKGDTLLAAVGLDSLPLGPQGDWRQLFFLHVSQSLRGQGMGVWLLDQAKKQAVEWGAKAVYASATPSVNTVDFYMAHGFEIAPEPDPRLFELDPEDIHLLCLLD
ncbi:GNAT family N-acetyltransferase [Alcaligenes faecalis]|uniref:GNAT family N-acetyltransferase n=1 Tax=Alcaligenes faecalis TaxID=511 RepID=UPI00208E8A4E|nr:GNAT family N-acetyltransferase [Alcaligenes faecalis]USP48403.1 GNAT family N-acetyltransferase [Alcaligenes faecalis]